MNLIYTTHQKVIEIDKTPARITLHFFGDVHRDSSCDVDRWKSFLKRTKETQDDYTFYIGMGDYCLPLDTEILTRDGWKTYDQINKGDIICGYDVENNCLKWQPLTGIYLSPSQEIFRMKSKSFDFRSTDNHGWFVKQNYKNDNKITKNKLKNLNSTHSILTAAKMQDQEDMLYLKITPEECYLLGWIVTDGHIRRNSPNHLNASITQSSGKYLNKLKELLYGKYTSSYITTNNCETINIKTSVVREIFEKAEFYDKNDLPKIVCKLNSICRRAMLNAFYEAEGWMDNNSTCFAQKEGGVLEAYRILETLEGNKIGLSNKKSNGVVTHKTTGKKYITYYDLKIDKVSKEPVWCPITPLSSIIAKQGNCITITGNCDFASMSEQKKLLGAGLHNQTMDNIDASVERMNRAFCIEIAHMRGKLLGMIEGNHSWFFVNTGRTSTEDMCNRMGCDYLGWLTHYTLVFRLPNGSAQTFYIVACHGRAGGKTYGITLNQVADLKTIFPIADIYCMGHDHQRVVDPISVLIPVRGKENYRIKQKEQLLCRSGSFKKSYEPGRGGYEMSRLLKPANLGALQVNIDISRVKVGSDWTLATELSAIV